MTSLPRIAVDAMGGDGGPAVTVPAAAALAGRAEITLVGDAARIEAALPGGARHLRVIHTDDALRPADRLSDVLRRRPRSSLRLAIECQAEGGADATVSAGDTAAVMALGRSLLAMVPGIERPAICKDLDGMSGPFWMLDLGANLDCTPANLHQFAHMGTLLARHVGGIDAPRAALLNIGTEAGKGPSLQREAAELLERDPALDYAGFVEGNVLFSGAAEVVVADGFAGNVALKSIEGAARMAGHLLRQWVESLQAGEREALAPLGRRLHTLREALNPQRYNGASLVGLAGVVVKSHGSADIEGFRSAIEEAILEVEGSIPRHLAAEFG